MKKIRFLRSGSGDWIGLYIDGKLVKEGHCIREDEMIEILFPKLDVKTVYGSEDLEEYGNRCPPEWPPKLEEKWYTVNS